MAGHGCDLISSDYNAIEAVVIAALAGEQWRLDVFRGHGRIYEQSASLITGIPLQEIIDHRTRTGEHHPARRVGKVAELGGSFGGGVRAWQQFGAIGTDDEIMQQVKAWRRASPAIVNLWYELERTVLAAIDSPGTEHTCRSLAVVCRDRVLTIRLPSGRPLRYQNIHTRPDVTPWGKPTRRIMYYSHRHIGGWRAVDTYGSKMVENCVQAIARDILAHALVQLEQNGYPAVLHVHDEPVSEVQKGRGNIKEYEQIMCDLPAWCRGWPIRASGGWVGRRYRK